MFYLLYDNRIIDSQKEDVYVYEFQIHKWLHKNNEHKTCFGLLKNQSENVVDLIDVGDLVKLDKTLNQVITILKEDKRTIFEIGDNKWFSFKELNNYLNNNRLAIYKPDYKDNYIKVWERKE